MFTGLLGADTRPRRDLLTGVALARSEGDMGYRLTGEDGTVDATLTSVFPYGHWKPREDLGLWAMLGRGMGQGTAGGQGRHGANRDRDADGGAGMAQGAGCRR